MASSRGRRAETAAWRNLAAGALVLGALIATPGLAGAFYPLDGGAGAEKLVLRLADVGLGYQVGDDSGCGIGVENASPAVASLVLTYWPIKGCGIQYEKLWNARKAGLARRIPYVSSSAYIFGTEDGARAGFQVAADLLGYEEGLERPEILARPDRPALGDEASTAFVPNAFALGIDHLPGVAVFWRKGLVLATVFVVGRSEPHGKAIALALARRQEARIERPTRLRPSEIDDDEVPLDDPRLEARVYWLGRRFAPGGFPGLRFSEVFQVDRRDPEWPGESATIDYQGRQNGVELTLWAPRRWTHFRRTKGGRGFWDKPCARGRVVTLRHGYAELFRSCTKRHAHFVAFAHLPGAVVDAGSYCWKCTGEGAYGSFKGLTAVVRALHRRRPRA
jgi:hypothetical protein